MKLLDPQQLKHPWIPVLLALFAKRILQLVYMQTDWIIVYVVYVLCFAAVPLLIGRIFYNSSRSKKLALYGLLGFIQVFAIGPLIAFLVWRHKYGKKRELVSIA
jgi:hypothetical protein